MELKLYKVDDFSLENSSFNRTFMELKQMSSDVDVNKSQILLIAPLWN